MVAGRKPKPMLQVVREGNPGRRPIRDAVHLPPSALVEPDWDELLPGDRDEQARARATAHGLWLRLAPTLARSVGLVGEQQEQLVDYCLVCARIEQGERALSREGLTIPGAMGGYVRNPVSTTLNQYRAAKKFLIGELGLSPSAATRLGGKGDDDGPDPFDD